MPTTSNFGWTTPADTDLVKDGAAAIRTLGNGIDTSLVDLKGGTTGQNLRKASNTDLDFTFAGDATNTVIDAEGDLLVGDSADTLQRLAVGTTGQVLTVDTTLDGKIKWATPASGLTFAGCRLTQSTSNAIANQTWSALNYNTETFDTDAFHNTSTNNTRITIPSGKAGYYQFYANATIQSTNTTTVINQQFYKNGAEVSQPYIRTGGVGYDSVMIVTVLNLAVGDYIEHYMWQNSGAERQIENGFMHFGCVYLGA